VTASATRGAHPAGGVSRRAAVAARPWSAAGATRTPALRARHPAARSGQPDDLRVRRGRSMRRLPIRQLVAVSSSARLAGAETRTHGLGDW